MSHESEHAGRAFCAGMDVVLIYLFVSFTVNSYSKRVNAMAHDDCQFLSLPVSAPFRVFSPLFVHFPFIFDFAPPIYIFHLGKGRLFL